MASHKNNGKTECKFSKLTVLGMFKAKYNDASAGPNVQIIMACKKNFHSKLNNIALTINKGMIIT